MLKDWDFAQFFPNWSGGGGGDAASRTLRNTDGKSTSSSSTDSSSTTSAKMAASSSSCHRRNESDSLAAAPPVRLLWAGRQRSSVREPTLADEPVSLTEFSRKASQLELRNGAGRPPDFAPPRREKTDLLDVRRLELKKELEERRRAVLAGNGSVARLVRQASSRPPLTKSTSEPCAPLALFRDHAPSAQVNKHGNGLRL